MSSFSPCQIGTKVGIESRAVVAFSVQSSVLARVSTREAWSPSLKTLMMVQSRSSASIVLFGKVSQTVRPDSASALTASSLFSS